MRKLWILLALIAITFSTGSTGYAWPQDNPAGMNAAPEFNLKDIQGKDISSAQFKGKITVISFWATWCYWCRKESAQLNKLYGNYKDKGVEVVGISVDEGGILDVGPFLRVIPMNYKVLLASPSMAMRLGINGLPVTMVVNKDWKIFRYYPGYMDYEVFEKDVLVLSGGSK